MSTEGNVNFTSTDDTESVDYYDAKNDSLDTSTTGYLTLLLFLILVCMFCQCLAARTAGGPTATANRASRRRVTSPTLEMHKDPAKLQKLIQERKDFLMSFFDKHNMGLSILSRHFDSGKRPSFRCVRRKSSVVSRKSQHRLSTGISPTIIEELEHELSNDEEETASNDVEIGTDTADQGKNNVGDKSGPIAPSSNSDIEQGRAARVNDNQAADADADDTDDDSSADSDDIESVVASIRSSFVSAGADPAKTAGIDSSFRSTASADDALNAGTLQIPHPSQPEKTLILNGGCCPICLDTYEIGDSIIASASPAHCCHAFHQECIVNYLIQLSLKQDKSDARQPPSRYTRNLDAPIRKAPCPICRQDFMYDQNNSKWKPLSQIGLEGDGSMPSAGSGSPSSTSYVGSGSSGSSQSNSDGTHPPTGVSTAPVSNSLPVSGRAPRFNDYTT